jgi:hypothetical protein
MTTTIHNNNIHPRRQSFYADSPLESSWDDFAPPPPSVESTESSVTRDGAREVSVSSSDRWMDDDNMSQPYNHDVITVHWDSHMSMMNDHDNSSMHDLDGTLVDCSSHCGIILGVSVPDYNRHYEPDDEYHGFNNNKNMDFRQFPCNEDDDNYIEELYFEANHSDLDYSLQGSSNYYHNDDYKSIHLPPHLRESFRKRRADLAACMEATRKTRKVLHEHMKQRGSLIRVLSDIEKSSQNVHKMMNHDNEEVDATLHMMLDEPN